MRPWPGIDEVLDGGPARVGTGREIGRSRGGRPIEAFRFGRGKRRVSLLGGCHADEPVGPLFLRHLANWLGSLPDRAPLLGDFEWWLVPHINPDGERLNRAWYSDSDEAYDVATYLAHVVRELPGDDIEFGFPHGPDDSSARPENRAAYDWWCTAVGPFDLHASLHGMGFAAGPWHLIEPTWVARAGPLMEACREAVAAMDYALHDVERHGEKGFCRIGPGFCTRPDSRSMREHFVALGDERTAARFRPSSMETMRQLGGDPLTLVSEMPLFITPGVGVDIGPPDPVAAVWKNRIMGWRTESLEAVRNEAARSGLRPMPVRDQMALQWALITAGLEL